MRRLQRFLSGRRETDWSCGLGIVIFRMQSLLLIIQNSNLKVANFLLACYCQNCCFPLHQTLLFNGFLSFGISALGFYSSSWTALWLWQQFESTLTPTSFLCSSSSALSSREPLPLLVHGGYRLWRHYRPLVAVRPEAFPDQFYPWPSGCWTPFWKGHHLRNWS